MFEILPFPLSVFFNIFFTKTNFCCSSLNVISNIAAKYIFNKTVSIIFQSKTISFLLMPIYWRPCLFVFWIATEFFKKVSKYICSNVDSHGKYLLNSEKKQSRYNKSVRQIKLSVNLNRSRCKNLQCLHVVKMCIQVFKWCFIMHWYRILCYNNLLYDRDVDISLIVWSCTDQCQSLE